MTHHEHRSTPTSRGRLRMLVMSGIVTAIVVAVISGALALLHSLGGRSDSSGDVDTGRPVSSSVTDGRATADELEGRGTIFYAGDSLITKYVDDPDSARQGFWSMLSRQLRERSVLDAEGGSGFVKPGVRSAVVGAGSGHSAVTSDESRCDGSTYQQRLTSRTARLVGSADAVVVEGGRNDFHTCDGTDRLVPVSKRELRSAITTYLDRIASLRTDLDPASVYVMTPWGAQVDDYDRLRVIPIIEQATRQHGFTWIDLGSVLDARRIGENTYDGIHPNPAGNAALMRAVLQRSDLAQRIRGLQVARS